MPLQTLLQGNTSKNELNKTNTDPVLLMFVIIILYLFFLYTSLFCFA